jgi:hypothetical protein
VDPAAPLSFPFRGLVADVILVLSRWCTLNTQRWVNT